tara:strand:+ start:3645 stop:4172 length:528 start_codon:yes stop_codon:yes gene_type:complete
MQINERTCLKCEDTMDVKNFISGKSKFTTCKHCRYKHNQKYKFKKIYNLDITTCGGDCPDDGFATSIYLQRIRDDGIIACLGCKRKKKRQSHNITHRENIQLFCLNKACMYCNRECNKFLDLDYFDLVNSNDKVINYSRIIRKSKKINLNEWLTDLECKIVCLLCEREHMTSHLR